MDNKLGIQIKLQAFRLPDGEDPFVLYQESQISKGTLLMYIAKALGDYVQLIIKADAGNNKN